MGGSSVGGSSVGGSSVGGSSVGGSSVGGSSVGVSTVALTVCLLIRTSLVHTCLMRHGFLKTDARRPSELSHNAGLKKKVFYKLRCMQTPHVPLPGGELAPDIAATRPRRPCFKSCTSSQTLQ